MNRAQILRNAAKIVEAGWCQGDYFIDDRCCMIGAIAKAAQIPEVDIRDVEERFRGVLTEVTREYHYPHLWNDNPSRTKEEVIAALLRAADMVEAEG